MIDISIREMPFNLVNEEKSGDDLTVNLMLLEVI